MQFFDKDELLNMKAYTDLMLEKTQGKTNIDFHDLQVYIYYAYMYENQYPDKWAEAIKALDDDGDETYANLDFIRQTRARLQQFVDSQNEKSVNAYNENPIKTTQPFDIKNLAYKEALPVQQQCLLLEGDYMRLRDEICLKYEKEYNDFHLEAAKARDEAIANIENTKKDQDAIIEAQMDETYQNYLRQKDELETQIKDLEVKYKNAPEAYRELKATSDKAIFKIEELMQARFSEVLKEIYARQAQENKEQIQAINDDFKQKVDGKFTEINNKIKDELTKSIENKLTEATNARKDRIQKFVDNELGPKCTAIREEVEEKDFSFVDENMEHYKDSDEEEINTSEKKSDGAPKKQEEPEEKLEEKPAEKPAEKQEEKFEIPEPNDYMKAQMAEVNNSFIKEPEEESKPVKDPESKIPENSVEQKIQEGIDIENYENDMIRRTIEAIQSKAGQRTAGYKLNFMDNENAIGEFNGILGHKECWEREKICVEQTYQEDKDRFRVSQKNHFDRINGIHRILKENRKTGLTSNSDEYKEVLNQLDIYEKGLIEKGWYDIVVAEKNGISLTKEQEVQKAEMLKQLDSVYEAGANYMVKKGPQKKSWGHGQARYELMYLLCDEIYTQGGHGAEARSRLNRLEKEIRAGKSNPSAYRHQIPNAAYSKGLLLAKYETFINQAIEGTTRNPGTRLEIAQKREVAKGGNNIIQHPNLINNI